MKVIMFLIVSMFVAVIYGFWWGVHIPIESKTLGGSLIHECEQNLPRNQRCEIVITAKVKAAE